jgi:hypothetical protein
VVHLLTDGRVKQCIQKSDCFAITGKHSRTSLRIESEGREVEVPKPTNWRRKG